MNKTVPIIVILIALVGGYFLLNNSTGEPNGIETKMGEAEAKTIAEKTCIKGGEALGGGTYNENSNTWWFDANLNATKPGCSPACVVDAVTRVAEINWRCTGAIPPEPTVTTCLPAERKADVCTADYTPVCATVQIQCIKAPCNPVQQTFSNSCTACKNPLVSAYIAGECQPAGVRAN